MKFVVNSKDLLSKIKKAQGAINSNSTVPILENLLFEVKDGKLTIFATDLQISIKSVIDVDVEYEGAVCIPAKMLLDTVASLPEQLITISLDKESFVVQVFSSNGKYRLAGENAENFPNIQANEDLRIFNFESEVFNAGLLQTSYCASKEEMKLAMCGVFVEFENSQISFVSTDGHRLVQSKEVINQNGDFYFIIPNNAVKLLKDLPADSTELQVEFNDNHAYFKFNNTVIGCRLIDENFPNYQSVIPQDNDKEFEINRKDLINSLKRTLIFSNKTTKQVQLNFKDNELEISAEEMYRGCEAKETLFIEGDSEIEIGFNGQFLIDCLTNLQSDKVMFKLSESNRAGLIYESDNDNLMALIMPVMLNNYY